MSLRRLSMVVMGLLGCVYMGYAQSPLLLQGEAQPLDQNINSALDELAPILEPVTGHLYFVRIDHPQNIGGRSDKGDIWYASREEDNWSVALNADIPLNNAWLNHLIGFSDSGTVMYLSHQKQADNGTAPKTILARAMREGDLWGEPQPISIPYFWSKSDLQGGWIQPDGELLLLALESFGSYGNEDLYVSFRHAGGNWSALSNLGSDINTPYQERSPFLLPDGRTLVFATNGKDGYGSWDLYQSQRLDDSWMQWSTPENLGPAINTAGAETFFFMPEGEPVAYFVRAENSDGYSNLWRIPVAQETLDHLAPAGAAPTGRLVKQADNRQAAPVIPFPPLVYHVIATDQSTGDKVPAGSKLLLRSQDNQIDTTLEITADGQAQFSPSGSGDHILEFILPGFLPLTQKVSMGGSGNVSLPFAFVPIRAGDAILADVYFLQGKAEFLEDPHDKLQKIMYLLEQNSDVSLLIAGHTDNQGDATENLLLSRARAEAVINYLIEKGVDKARLSSKGYGSTRPVASNKNEKGRTQNRRVEFIIQKQD